MLTNEEDIELLEKDLCGRLPYLVYVSVDVKNYLEWLPDDDDESQFKKKLKIYLEVSKKTVEDISKEPTTISGFPCGGRFDTYNWDNEQFGVPVAFIKPYYRSMSSMTEEEMVEYDRLFSISIYKLVDWLDMHMFDYRGLIKRGIAQEAPEDMYVFFDLETGGRKTYWRRS